MPMTDPDLSDIAHDVVSYPMDWRDEMHGEYPVVVLYVGDRPRRYVYTSPLDWEQPKSGHFVFHTQVGNLHMNVAFDDMTREFRLAEIKRAVDMDPHARLAD